VPTTEEFVAFLRDQVADYEHWVPDCTLHSEIFLAHEVPIDSLTVTEGTLKIVTFDELEQIQDVLAPSAKRALEIFRLTRPASVARRSSR
jgi:hypothetical protein